MSLKVNIRHLEAGDVLLRGELSVEEAGLDFPDELVHARQPVRYDLTAQKSGRDVLVQGKIALVLDCECARCLKAFQQPGGIGALDGARAAGRPGKGRD